MLRASARPTHAQIYSASPVAFETIIRTLEPYESTDYMAAIR